MSNSKNLADVAMLARLNIHTWGARVQDTRIGKAAAAQYQADEDRIGGILRLLPGGIMRPWVNVTNRLRKAHGQLTVPYVDAGTGVLMSKYHTDYLAKVNPILSECSNVADSLVGTIHVAIQSEAARQGGLFDARNYPSDIRAHFGARVRFLPFPERSAFDKLGLNGAGAGLAAGIDALETEVATFALQDIQARVVDVCSAIVDRMRAYTGSREGSFKDTLVENARDLVACLPALNITADPKVEQVRTALATLATVDPDDLRESPEMRKDAEQEAAAILASVNAWM